LAGGAIDEILQFIRRSAASYPMLTAAEEIQLGRQIRAWQDHPDGPDGAPAHLRRRGQRALERFVACNLRLAMHIARRYTGRGVPLEDLTQAAAIGLQKAYTKFDPALGYRSSSYATWFAQQRCQVLVAQSSSTIRLPAAVRDAVRSLAQASERCCSAGNHSPTNAELAAEMGIGVDELIQLRFYAGLADGRSLDEFGPSQVVLRSEVDLTGGLMDDETRRLVRGGIASCPGLTPQQRYLLRCQFLDPNPPSLPKLASSLQMSRRLVKALTEEAIWRLRHAIRGYQQNS
jgi:RNA polymerase primary sigma factor